jgi:anti-sigma B factor antagonist
MNSLLSVASERVLDQPIALITVAGRLDASTIGQLERALNDSLVAASRAIVVDLSGLTYVSSSGLRVLLAARSAMRKRGGDVFLCALNPNVRAVFDMVGFTAVFGIFDTQAQGLEAATIVIGR